MAGEIFLPFSAGLKRQGPSSFSKEMGRIFSKFSLKCRKSGADVSSTSISSDAASLFEIFYCLKK